MPLPTRTSRRHVPAALVGLTLLASCSTPQSLTVRGTAATAPAPHTPWRPPATDQQTPGGYLPWPDSLAQRRQAVTIADLVSLALERNPETRAAWLTARSAAARLGEQQGAWFPTVQASLGAGLTGESDGGTASRAIGPALSLNWLLFDRGGRTGSRDAAEAALLSADWTHNAVLADLVRRTAQGWFAYAGTTALLAAEQATLAQARLNLAAAEDRRTVGVATIADVLQARTAVAEAVLAAQSVEGAVATARGALATLAGLPPTTDFAIDSSITLGPIGALTDSVNVFMAQAVATRPDLAAARSLAEQRRQEARSIASRRFPALTLNGSGTPDWIGGRTGGTSWQLGLGLAIPIFNGRGWEFAAQAAALASESQEARVQRQEQQAALEVFIAYQELRTATQRVTASEDLLISATESAAAARARYRGEVGSLLELLNAERALADARAQYIQAQVRWQTQLVQLAHDAGMLQLDGSAPLRLTPIPSALPDSLR